MNSKILLSLSFAFTSVVLAANPLLANPLHSNLRPVNSNASALLRNQTLSHSNNRYLAQTPDTQATEAQAPISENWVDFPEIEAGFMEGCVGTETLAAGQATTKQSYCQCAFEAYSGRFSPQQFLQINALANRAEEDGPLLVNLMMAPELESCSATTGYQP